MKIKPLNNWTKPATILFLIIFSAISYILTQNLLNNITKRADNKLKIAENFINFSIQGANQIIYGLALSLAQESINAKNKNIINIIKSFDHKMERHNAIPLYGFKVLDHKDFIIRSTLIPDKLFTTSKTLTDLSLLKKAKKKPFELQIGRIRLGKLTHKNILPFCMSIENNKTFIGSICSGITIDKLSERLNYHITSKHINRINLLGIVERNNQNKANNHSTLSKILDSYFKNKNLIIQHPLTNYPIVLEAEINCYYLAREIGAIAFYCICYLIAFILFVYYIHNINKKYYLKPLTIIQKKLHEYSDHFSKRIPEFNKLYFDGICPYHLSQAVNYIIDHCINSKEESSSPSKLHNNLLHLMLTERHYCISTTKVDIGSGDLYLNELRRQINSKDQSQNLKSFLDKITQYCAEYYSELKIKVIIEEEDHKDFNFKHTALSETIFNIFTTITRIGNFDVDNFIILRAHFHNNTSPNINIEVLCQDSSLHPLGWEYGPEYIYTSLLSVYLLAKENNFFFHIEQKENKIMFVLEPLSDDRLQIADDLYKKASSDTVL